MHEIVSRAADIHVPAATHERWWSRHAHDTAHRNQERQIGAAFADVGIRQSAAPHVQAKLTVSHPEDSAELEADRVADAVMQTSTLQPEVAREEDPALQRACAACTETETEARVDRVAEQDDELDRAIDGIALDRAAAEDEESLQAKHHAGDVPQVTPELAARIDSVRGTGAPLARETRAFFEPRLGVDLRDVRVNTGSQAASVARELNARAFTVGNDVTFGAGQYQPTTNDGKRLIAHELTHVIQQGGASARRNTKRSR